MLTTTLDAEKAGFDPERLQRLERHFAAYVEDGRLPGWELAITRGSDVVHVARHGWTDVEAQVPVGGDTLWRIASMTKPIVTVAAMSLWEEGKFELTDPISRWLPEFADARVYARGSVNDVYTVPVKEPIRVWHLMSHASGLTAGFIRTHVVDELYRRAGFDFFAPPDTTLAEGVSVLASMPLLFEPGSAWGYGVSTDVLGRLVELWSGQRLDEAVAARVTGPLGMTDTVWWADPSRAARLPKLYAPNPATRELMRYDLFGDVWLSEPVFLSGGGGLCSTLADYTRFTRMLAGAGTFEGVRVLAPSTLRLMAANHLPGELGELSTGGFAETSFDGVGFGLGFAVVLDPVRLRNSSSQGEFYWGGAASTAFWIDPVHDLTCTFMTQLLPSSTYPIRPQLRQLVYSALVSP